MFYGFLAQSLIAVLVIYLLIKINQSLAELTEAMKESIFRQKALNQ